MTLDGKDRVVVDTGIIMAVIAYRSKSLVPVFEKARSKAINDLQNHSDAGARQADKGNAPVREEIIEKYESVRIVVEINVLHWKTQKALFMREIPIWRSCTPQMSECRYRRDGDNDFFDEKNLRRVGRSLQRPREYCRRMRMIQRYLSPGIVVRRARRELPHREVRSTGGVAWCASLCGSLSYPYRSLFHVRWF